MRKIIFISLLSSILCYGCKKEDDIDLSTIDFSNIENLYTQPLPVIQKCVQGKWKWFVTYGGVVGESYHDNTFVDIYEDYCVITSDNGEQRTFNYRWKKIYAEQYKRKAWVIWDTDINREAWCFSSIKNDTIGVGGTHSGYPYMAFVWARVKSE
ncbi:hypothetical protein [Parabacteroides sp. PF5-9]|uniref:hypothetical protein n=1 Tax=Parabacteroides sp. PF5-9 TaxID=1742404 RepID=UPI002476F9BB|nr:hypothetical protein [Parabacteroides sp. PF5-9]MDH6358393.1 hypothetical protein [Parabacteroides sp. PF5-9]